MGFPQVEKGWDGTHVDPVHVEKSELEHIEITDKNASEISSLDHETLAYGKNGIAGIVSSPFVFGVACLASMGGFSFGEQ